jgi:hypothetical protein
MHRIADRVGDVMQVLIIRLVIEVEKDQLLHRNRLRRFTDHNRRAFQRGGYERLRSKREET